MQVKSDPPAVGEILVDGRQYPIHEGDTIGSCLMRAGILRLRHSMTGEVRGIFCGIGICNDCLIVVDGQPNVRACQVDASPGVRIEIAVS